MIPQDPVMLLSYVNTQLRDFYPSLEEFCMSMDLDQNDIVRKLETIQYRYSQQRNQFV